MKGSRGVDIGGGSQEGSEYRRGLVGGGARAGREYRRGPGGGVCVNIRGGVTRRE